MITAGLSLDMQGRGVPVAYPNLDKQIKELHRRLESSEGMNRYCDSDAIFSHDVVLPAVMRAGVGLGLEAGGIADARWRLHRQSPCRGPRGR